MCAAGDAGSAVASPLCMSYLLSIQVCRFRLFVGGEAQLREGAAGQVGGDIPPCSCVDFEHVFIFCNTLLQVARRSFVKALHEMRAVLFVPGGQAELVHTHRATAASREWVAYTGHKGLQCGAIPH